MKNIIQIIVSIIIFIIVLPLMIILDILIFFAFTIGALFFWLYDEDCKHVKLKTLYFELYNELIRISSIVNIFTILFKK